MIETFAKIEKNKGIAIALGFFDGMHLGHRKIIKTLVTEGKKRDIKTAVVTFSQNPANYFSEKQIPNIQSSKERELILEELGVDYLYELDFEEYKNLLACEYLSDVLVKYFQPKLIITGYNHTFGADVKGSSFIKENEDKYNYDCIIVPEVLYQHKEEVSSTIIRKHITQGHLNAANALLGKNFSIINSVIAGKKLASNLGYPTANIVWPDSIVKLPYGVYFGYAVVEERTMPALIAWGVSPTTSADKEEKLEAHLYDFDKNIYGKIMRLIFVKKLRNEEYFPTIAILKEQLDSDWEAFEQWAKQRF